MAKSSPFSGAFNEKAFRSAVYGAMAMGIPEDPAQRVVFKWRRERTYEDADPGGSPYEWNVAPTSDLPSNPASPDTGTDQEVTVPYALEFSERAGTEVSTTLGAMDVNRAVITLLDVDYAKVKTADYVTVAGREFRIMFDSPPVGLFGVTVWQRFVEASD